jgi:hypothetical protein
MEFLNKHWLVVTALIVALLAWPPQWYPMSARLQLTRWFGAADFRPLPESLESAADAPEVFCPPDFEGWRAETKIDGVDISASAPCVADNPFAVAAFVKGTNNVSQATLLKSGLTADAVTKGRDLDGDGDPDEIHIRLEVAELNGGSPNTADDVTQYEIAPGIRPGMWVFAPKLAGMAVENLESNIARDTLRAPSPAIRIEQGDTVKITLENSHYMPHTLHLHGADHSFRDVTGEGNDGVPLTSELPVMPGNARTYELTPRHAGTMFYHCHVQPHVHVMMGLQGLFVIEENRPNNWLQTMNIGAGQVRVPSVASKESYDQEYDLHYFDLDKQLGERVQANNDPRLITQSMHRDYDITDSTVDYFLLNGKSFPYTFRESLIVGEENDRIKLRVVNGGSKGIALHTHGHKFTITDRDGGALPEETRIAQDVAWLATTQRVDVELLFRNDGLHSYSPGIWLFHDHQYKGITNDGIGPGGNISALVYTEFMDDAGWPKTQGVSWDNYFTENYYRRQTPVWKSYGSAVFSEAGTDWRLFLRLLLFALASGVLVTSVLGRVAGRVRR